MAQLIRLLRILYMAAQDYEGEFMLVSLENVYKYYNGEAILENINFTINQGERIGLVGVNGCGKTTLLSIITGKTS